MVLLLSLLLGCGSDIGVNTTQEVVYENVIEEVTGEVVVDGGSVAERQMDIMFIVDNSCSMIEEHGFLMGEIPNTYAALEGGVFADIDWRIGVRSADPNEPLLGIVEKTDTNPVFSLVALIAALGTRGRWEMGLATAITSMGADNDFHREDAHLMVVFISDEPDQSSLSPTEYLNLVDLFKEDPYQVLHTAIVYLPTDTSEDCGFSGTLETGIGYLEVADEQISLCTPDTWGAMLNNAVALAPMFNSVWPLSETPTDIDKIQVLINGEETYAWSYDTSTNAVVLDEAPPAGALITIIYLKNEE